MELSVTLSIVILLIHSKTLLTTGFSPPLVSVNQAGNMLNVTLYIHKGNGASSEGNNWSTEGMAITENKLFFYAGLVKSFSSWTLEVHL